MLDPLDTIAAISSPPGPGLRGLVRLTGPRALEIATDRFSPRWDDRPERAEIREGVLAVDGVRAPLPATLALWPGPRTYTGQPLAEIHTVGSVPLLQAALAHCLARGARPAEPGEFTLRAFLSGRLDLTRAEAVLGVIDARSPSQLDAALRQLAGGLSGPLDGVRDRLLDLLAHLEATLDFAEEPDVDLLGREALSAQLARDAEALDRLADRLRGRDRPGGMPVVVLAGPPNAGKSRLFNALLGGDRAIVSPVAGTTRDYLAAPLDCDGLTVELVDTAGAEPAANAIQDRAQSLRAGQAARADLVLHCRSADASPFDFPAGPRRLTVWTKADLAPAPAPETLSTSAADGEGLDRLRKAIAVALREQPAGEDESAGQGARCRDGLLRAKGSLLAASECLTLGGGDELVAIDVRQAIDELGKVVGAVVNDELLDRIFRRFCIGK